MWYIVSLVFRFEIESIDRRKSKCCQWWFFPQLLRVCVCVSYSQWWLEKKMGSTTANVSTPSMKRRWIVLPRNRKAKETTALQSRRLERGQPAAFIHPVILAAETLPTPIEGLLFFLFYYYYPSFIFFFFPFDLVDLIRLWALKMIH